MAKDLIDFTATINNEALRLVALNCVRKYNDEYTNYVGPGAKYKYPGGLRDHSLKIAEVASGIAINECMNDIIDVVKFCAILCDLHLLVTEDELVGTYKTARFIETELKKYIQSPGVREILPSVVYALLHQHDCLDDCCNSLACLIIKYAHALDSAVSHMSPEESLDFEELCLV